MNVTSHFVEPYVSDNSNGQLLELNNPAAPVLVHDTVPLGLPPLGEVTTTVQVLGWLTTTADAHETLIETGFLLTGTEVVPELVS